MCIRSDETREGIREVVWIILNGILRCVVGLRRNLVVGQATLGCREAIKTFPSVHLKYSDIAAVHVCITLVICQLMLFITAITEQRTLTMEAFPSYLL